MKKSQKNMLKAALVIALLCPAAFADGDMGGGGLIDCDNPASSDEVVICTQEGDMGGGGRMSDTGSPFDTLYLFMDSVIREIF